MDFKDFKKLFSKADRPDLEEKGATLYTSFTFAQGHSYNEVLNKLGFKYLDGFLCEPYYMVWCNREVLSIFSYCEGDINLMICNDFRSYQAQVMGHVDCLADQFEGSAESAELEGIL